MNYKFVKFSFNLMELVKTFESETQMLKENGAMREN